MEKRKNTTVEQAPVAECQILPGNEMEAEAGKNQAGREAGLAAAERQKAGAAGRQAVLEVAVRAAQAGERQAMPGSGMAGKKSEKGAKSRASVKRELQKQLKQKGWWNSICAELVESYLDARDRLQEAETSYEQMVRHLGLTPADDEAVALNGTIAACAKTMTDVLQALQIAPASQRRAAIEAEMRQQLQVRGLTGAVFGDRVDAFLQLWDAFQDANRSLCSRGRTYMTISSAGKTYEKDNAAAKDVVALSKAMGDILDELKITVDDYADLDDEL